MNYIHETAIVLPDARARMGDGNYIGPYCVIGPCVQIGNANRFEAFVSVGLPAEKYSFFDRDGIVIIGNDNVLREFVTVNAGTTRVTKMGDRCVMLRGSHLSHDSVLEDDVTVSCTVMIGGESYVMKGANLGLGAVIHQRSCIGSYSMLGMGSVVTRKAAIAPGCTYVGNPAEFLCKNNLGLSRRNIGELELLDEISRWTKVTQEYCAVNHVT